MYSQLPSHGRPLSYGEILLRWSEAVVQVQFAVNDTTEAQQACDDYGSAVHEIVGTQGYAILLKQLLSVVETHRLGERSGKRPSVNVLIYPAAAAVH